MSRYLGTAEIAADLGLSQKYVTDRIVKRPDFPAPKIALSQKTRRWLRDEFEKWKRAQQPS